MNTQYTCNIYSVSYIVSVKYNIQNRIFNNTIENVQFIIIFSNVAVFDYLYVIVISNDRALSLVLVQVDIENQIKNS